MHNVPGRHAQSQAECVHNSAGTHAQRPAVNMHFPTGVRNESSGFDNATIKADFEELYRLMNGKPLKEIDEIIYAVCTLCRDHEQAGFIEGVKVGMSLASDLFAL